MRLELQPLVLLRLRPPGLQEDPRESLRLAFPRLAAGQPPLGQKSAAPEVGGPEEAGAALSPGLIILRSDGRSAARRGAAVRRWAHSPVAAAHWHPIRTLPGCYSPLRSGQGAVDATGGKGLGRWRAAIKRAVSRAWTAGAVTCGGSVKVGSPMRAAFTVTGPRFTSNRARSLKVIPVRALLFGLAIGQFVPWLVPAPGD